MIGKSLAQERSSFHNINATKFIATLIGVYFGLFSSVNHGIFEILQGNRATDGLLINAIGEAQRFWVEGYEPAFSIVGNYRTTGILSVVVGFAIAGWSIWFLDTKHGRTVYLGLFILSFLVGGGIGQVFFFLPAWAFATRMNRPLTWWRNVLPQRAWPLLSKIWMVTLALATLMMTITLEIGIFGFFPGISRPEQIQNAAMICMFCSAFLYIFTFIAGFGHELMRMERP